MAKDSDDCEHRFLPQFLTDDDDELFADLKTSSKKNDARNTAKSCFGMDSWHEFGYGLGPFGSQSGLSSPLEGSTETESDDDDYVTGLTQRLAHSTFEDPALTYETNKLGWGLSSSPQSTLCSALCGGCGCYHGSSRPNCPSKAASPRGINKTDAAWDLLLHAAAGEVSRMRVMEGAGGFYPNKNGGLVGPPTKPSTISVPQRIPSPSLGFRPDHQTHLSHQQHLKVAQFEQLRQQQMMRQQQQQQQQEAMGVWGQAKFQFSQTQQMMLNSGRSGGKKPNLSMAAWPTLEQQSQRPLQHPGSGMRAVFLGNPNIKRECAGTGVFLPRRFGTPAVSRKKSGCSTVLLPDRVVQTLNLNLNKEGVDVPAQPAYNAGRASDYDAGALRYRNSSSSSSSSAGGMGQQQRGGLRQQAAVMNHQQVPELRLPQEWSY
ncbi:uncharacterized protein [Coffea arabica]|uniref:Uncharacterized protein n=1 Tax=Coffea arabica TaxID=13443 RepID=A0A6P6SQD3_COFAR|nr:uncharacterized protein LOC113693649 [Coffea arabica]